MLVKSLPTMLRRGAVGDDIENMHRIYECPAIDKKHLESYKHTFPGFVSEVPLTYFYLVAQRAHLALMLDDEFPWPLLGMVHVANDMKLLQPIDLNLPFRLEIEIKFPPRAGTRKRVRPSYSVLFFQKGECVVVCESTYQVGGGQKGKSRGREENVELEGWSKISDWHLMSDLGRRYAKLSGDFNPIHLHPWLSRWFGFARPIIHGMYSVARMQASLEAHLAKPITALKVGFKRPVILPTELICSCRHDQVRVSDVKQDKIFVEGVYQIGEPS